MAARAALGWSREKLAERCGFSHQVIERFENWKGNPSEEHKTKIIEAIEGAGIKFVSYIHQGQEYAGVEVEGTVIGLPIDKLFAQRMPCPRMGKKVFEEMNHE